MNSEICNSVREMFPLLANGTLLEGDRTKFVRHIKSCDACRDLLEREMPFYVLALKSPDQNSPLVDHPEVDELQAYADGPETVERKVRGRIRAHVAECELCRDLLTKLLSLHTDASNMLNGTTAPFLSSIDRELSEGRSFERMFLRARRALWSPAVGYAVAAASVVFLAIGIFVSRAGEEKFYPAAVVDVTIPSPTRAVSTPLTFSTPTQRSYFNIGASVQPEAGHTYDILLSRQGSGEIIKQMHNFSEFDNAGSARFRVLADTGDYVMTIRDIEGADTISLEQLFTVEYVGP